MRFRTSLFYYQLSLLHDQTQAGRQQPSSTQHLVSYLWLFNCLANQMHWGNLPSPALSWQTLGISDNQVSKNGDSIEVVGVVSQVLPGTMFRVKLENDHEVLAHIAGKMRKRRWIRLAVGDKVKMEMSTYDLDKARITWRLDNWINYLPWPNEPAWLIKSNLLI